MVVQMCFFKEKKNKKMLEKMLKSDIIYILHHNTTNFCMLVIFHIFFTPINQLKTESENEKYPYILFSLYTQYCHTV